MFRNQQNHPVSFTTNGLIVCQLLVQDCTECEYAMTTHNGCLLIPRGMQFPKDLFPEIVVLHNHATPYRDPKTGKEAPFVTIGPFSRRDMLFQGVARDLELYTAEEVITLRSMGIFKSSSGVSQSLPRLPSLASLSQIQSALPVPSQFLIVPRSNQTHHPRSESIKALQRVTSIQFQWLLEAVHLWKNPMSETMTLSTDGAKEVGNVRITLKQKTKAHIMSILPGMNMEGHLSTADLQNPVVPRGIPIQKNDDFTVEVDHVIVNTNAHAHQSMYTFHCLPTFILLP